MAPRSRSCLQPLLLALLAGLLSGHARAAKDGNGAGAGDSAPCADGASVAARPGSWSSKAELALARLERSVEHARYRINSTRVAGRTLPEFAQACGRWGAWGLLCTRMAPQAVQLGAGMARGLRFWRTALPIYVEYRLMQSLLSPGGGRRNRRVREGQAPLNKEERMRRWNTLHEKTAPHILRLALDLRGFYVKLGQVASTRQDMFPRPWTEALRKLQGEHPELLARPLKDVQKVLRQELGPMVGMLRDIEAKPVGAAATGQVHRARLEDGRTVVVKVQYPEAQRLYRQDFANTKLFCRLLQPEHLTYIEELEKQFYTEFDFRREASDLAEVTANFAKAGHPFAGKVKVPEPVPELSSRNVVVMEYLPGETLLSYGLRRKEQLERSWMVWRWVSSYFLLRELRSRLSLLLDVQGYQVFHDGIFNGDPHPGNVLLMPDGRLGLIDYGNVKRLTPYDRARLGRLVISLAKDDRAAAVRHAHELGFETRSNDPDVIFRLARLSFDRDDPESMTLPDGSVPANVQAYFEALADMDPMREMPPDFVMVARSSFLLRGLGTHFGMAMHVAARWRKYAERAIQVYEAAVQEAKVHVAAAAAEAEERRQNSLRGRWATR